MYATRAMRPAAATEARASSALRFVVSAFGAVVAFAGLEHGVGEMLQGPVRPTSWAIESWPDAAPFEILAGEPAMTIVPNMLVAGAMTMIVSLALGIWSIWFVHRDHGAIVLIGLSIALLLVGGGFSPPVLGIVLGIGAARIGVRSMRGPGPLGTRLARVWPWLTAIGVAAFLGLFPGLVMASGFMGVPDAAVYGLAGLAVVAMVMSLVAARYADRARSAGAD